MRLLPSSILWLAAASWPAMAKAQATSATQDVDFYSTGFANGWGSEPVFTVPTTTTTTTMTFEWAVAAAKSTGVTVTQVNLYVSATTGTTLVASATVSAKPSGVFRAGGGMMPTPTPPTVIEARLEDASGVAPTPSVSAVTLQGVNLGLAIWNDTTSTGHVILTEKLLMALGYHDQLLYFELLWHNLTGYGKSYSRWFALASSQESAQALVKDSHITNSTAALPEQTGLSSNPAVTTSSSSTVAVPIMTSYSTPSSASTSTAVSTSVEPSATQSADVTPGPGGSALPTTQSPHHGLSKGAIAGIAVAAAIVGLALLAGLILCLIRRNRRRDHHDSAISPGGYGNRATPELIAQKEANASVGVDQVVTPHSPYSDDGTGMGMAAHGGGRGSGGLRHNNTRQEEMPLAGGYADRAVSHRSVGPEDGGSLRGSQTGRVTPGRATPTAVRHLVEEGMTEDEIRRLEEEERELDQAIEQAGNGRR